MTTKQIVYKKLKNLTKTKFTDKSDIFEIGIDSLDLVELVTEAEDEIGIEVSDEQLEKIKTVGDVINALKSDKK